MMKKLVCLAIILMLAVTATGCGGHFDAGDDAVIEMKDWGITLTATNVTPTGLTIVCQQAEGAPQGSLQTGAEYWLEVYEDDSWQAVENLLEDKSSLSWTAEAWSIPLDDTVEWHIDWAWLYGQLPSGTYRIGKLVADCVEDISREYQSYYAVFEIE